MPCEDYGSGPNGFIRKPFTVIYDEIWADFLAADGNLVQDDKSPQGQIASIMADATNDLWMEMQGQSDNCDITKAEGCQLDKLAALVGPVRRDGETDVEFRARLLGVNDASNQSANTVLDTLITCLYGVEGVTCVDVNVNDTGNVSENGLPPHSYEVVVQGGDQDEIAQVIWSKHPVGITLYGNTSVDVPTQLNCQSVSFSRPVEVPICLDVTLKVVSNDCGCSESDIEVICDMLEGVFQEPCPSCRYGVGDAVIYNALFEPFYTQLTGYVVTNLVLNGGTDDVILDSDEVAVLDKSCLNITFE